MNKRKNKIVIFLGFWLLFLVFYILSPSVGDLIGRIIKMNAEYTVIEQLSKYYLLIMMLISINVYSVQNDLIKIKTAISFLLLGFILYLSESNIITEHTQPLFAVVILPYIFFLLFANHSWSVLFQLSIVFFIISLGFISDLIQETEFLKSLLPQYIGSFFLSILSYEEVYDVIGLGFVCLSSIFYFYAEIEEFIKNNFFGTIFLLMTAGIIAIGNGFLHWQYRPGPKLHLGAYIITLIGFLGLILTNKYIITKNKILTLFSEDFFYFFIFTFFVILPTLHGKTNDIVCMTLWFPSIFTFGLYLYYRHSLKSIKIHKYH
jgi:hypothetical protein